MPVNENLYPEANEQSGLNIDFRKLLADVLHYWWAFVLAALLAVVAVKVYHRYRLPLYVSQLSLIIDDSDKAPSTTTVSEQSMMSGFMLSSGMRNLNNQVAILSSYTLVSSAVDKLGGCVSYYREGRIRDAELYDPAEFRVVMDSTHQQLVGVDMHIDSVGPTSYRLRVKAECGYTYNYKKRTMSEEALRDLDFEGIYEYGEPVITDWCAFAVQRNGDMPKATYVRFNTMESLVNFYRAGYSVEYDDKSSSSVVTLSFVGTHQQRNNDFLNTIAKTFISSNLNQKNQMAENTIAFIGEQLSYLSDTLLNIGTQLSSFRAANDLQQPVSSKGTQLFGELQEYDRDREEEQMKKSYYVYLEKYFTSDSLFTGVIAPAVFDTKSASITKQLQDIMQLNTQRQSYQDIYGTSNNPSVREMMSKLQIARSTLLHSIVSHKALCDANIKDIEAKMDECRAKLNLLPETERKLLGIDRKFNLNNDVFTFLLRKRSEAEIQKASNMSDHKIIDYAMSNGSISTSEAKHRTLAVCGVVGLLVGLLVVRQLLDNKMRTLDDLKKLTDKPVIGSLLSNNKDHQQVVLSYPKSVQAEAFRMLRTKIDFLTPNIASPVIAISSSISGEGKTFCAFNIASVFSISGRRTMLLGFDLRKPSLANMVGKDNEMGLSDYIVGHASLDDVVMHVGDNLDVIFGGTIPPNPSELIDSDRTRDLMTKLRAEYDIIFIDTPPMGIVTDAYQLLAYSDALIFVVRQDYTERDVLQTTLEGLEEHGFKNVAIVLNDVNSKKARYISNGYKYGYGYGYGHHYGLRRGSKKGYGKYYSDYYGSEGYYSED